MHIRLKKRSIAPKPKPAPPAATMVPQFALHIILILCSLHTLASAQQDTSIAQPGCDSRCGSVDIPYPFGMNDPKCYADEWFEIECSGNRAFNLTVPILKQLDLTVTSIDSSAGTINLQQLAYTLNCEPQDVNDRRVKSLRGSPFVYSQERNKFVVQGCNQIAFLKSNGTRVSACASICDDNEDTFVDITTGKCNGKYCCETSLPLRLLEYNVTTEILRENQVSHDNCSYAAIVAQDFWASNNSSVILDNMLPEAVLEWEIVDSTLKLPATGNCTNTNVTSSQHNHSGRRCYCDEGYHGNPYIDGGCERGKAPSIAHTPVSLLGIIFASLGSIILPVGSWWMYKVLRKRIIKKRKEKYFKRNGGLLLQQKLSSGEVNIEKAKHFSLKDLEKATDHFNVNRVLGKGGQGTVYKGMLVDGQIIAVKKFSVRGRVEEFINEFVILSQISHRNVVKLLGCCLETEIPLLVYEFIPNGNLFEYLHDQNEDLPMTWEMRLRIATEVAGALFYLHSAANQPIYHRDIKSTNILLDGKYRTKVADFGASRMISIEDTHLTTVVQGTFGYLDPEYFYTSQFTEKSDVYSYGVVLVELLTGQKPISSLISEETKSLASHFVLSMEENRLFDIIDERVTKEGGKEHIIAVANLAYRCLALNGTKRPTMREVASELDGIWKLERKSNAQQNLEEIELDAIEDHQPWDIYSASDTMPTPSSITPTLEVMPILIK